jgi:hypothetical protein
VSPATVQTYLRALRGPPGAKRQCFAEQFIRRVRSDPTVLSHDSFLTSYLSWRKRVICAGSRPTASAHTGRWKPREGRGGGEYP